MQLALSPIAIPVQNSTLATLTGPLVNSSILFSLMEGRKVPSPKFQVPNRTTRSAFGAWNVEFTWNLEFGIWNFSPLTISDKMPIIVANGCAGPGAPFPLLVNPPALP
jgi:hypothetical protein